MRFPEKHQAQDLQHPLKYGRDCCITQAKTKEKHWLDLLNRPTHAKKKKVCDQWWRTGCCSKKRCKLSHRHTICHLEHVPDKGRDGAAEGTGKKKKNSKSKRKKNRGETKEQNNRESLPAMIRMPLEQIKAGGKLSYDKKLRTQRRQKSSLLFFCIRNSNFGHEFQK